MGIPRVLRVLVAAFVALAATPALAQDASFARAVSLQEAGDLDAAAAEYQRFLAAHPESVEARSNLGVVLVRLGRLEEAIAAYQHALERAPSNTRVRLNLGLALYKAVQLGGAAEAFERVLADEPGNLQARYLAAECHLRLGQPATTVTLLAPLERAHADDELLAYLLGLAYLGTGEREKGQLLIDRILRHGDSARARLLLGAVKRDAGDLKAALDDLQRAVALDPSLPGVHALYGQTLLEAGSPDLARAAFEEELARNPLDFDANLLMGVLFKNDQEHEAALRHFTRALGVRPGDIPTRYQIATVHLATRDTAAATALLEALVQEAPSFVEAHVALATAYYRQQRKADGDRHRAIVERLNREKEAAQR